MECEHKDQTTGLNDFDFFFKVVYLNLRFKFFDYFSLPDEWQPVPPQINSLGTNHNCIILTLNQPVIVYFFMTLPLIRWSFTISLTLSGFYFDISNFFFISLEDFNNGLILADTYAACLGYGNLIRKSMQH